LIEESRAGKTVAQLEATDEMLLNFVSRWSEAGVIIGFKEIK
jgi:hypothetical protein